MTLFEMDGAGVKAIARLPRLRWNSVDGASSGERSVPEETPVAIVHDGSTTAVMMATPADLHDFALGFSLSEGIIDAPDEVRAIDIVVGSEGIEARVWLKPEAASRHAFRRRTLIGPTGCGLCGIDSLAQAVRPARDLSQLGVSIDATALLSGLSELEQHQTHGRETRAIHAAGLWGAGSLIQVREDVGRHNALDKLVGATAAAGVDTRTCALILTSRVSVEMIQKAEVLGTPIVCAMSAPTALAVRLAARAGITLVAIARQDGFEIFTRPDRLILQTRHAAR